MTRLSISALEGIPEIHPDDDLAALIGDAAAASPDGIDDGDILVVTSKIVSKAEGRQVHAEDREAAITRETVRVVASRTHPGGVTRIVENRLGLVLAAAGVDNSNTPEGTVLLLPEDPDASARRLCAALRARFGIALGVILSDTLGRPWREGQTDVAIGAAGLRVLEDYRGTADLHGNVLAASAAAVADELAGAADLVKGKATGRPVAVVRGMGHLVLADLEADGESVNPAVSARQLVRPAENDMFRLGSDEAYAQGFADGRSAAEEFRVSSRPGAADESGRPGRSPLFFEGM
jgi:coenzyme F420-0:L-glutamate ligase / coenzyme F420-1:gamma-L-glutamate ligase